MNNDKLAAYGLAEHFTNLRPESAEALADSLAGAYERGEPWLGYYWGPTWVLSSFDLVALEEPPYTHACWEGDRGCAFPPSIIHIGVSKGFAEGASEEMLAFLRDYELEQQVVSEMLAYMRDNAAEASEAAAYFLKTRPEIWTAWLPDEVAVRVEAALN